ncbi:MAG: hypothetical protein IPM42_12230 [Saprospiraceae bacterium]|nr:hypothetical protein [Saprospiraceae bacterium]
MEELIWKYVDSICTDEENVQVQNLLKTDPQFKSQFDAILDLNNQLAAVSFVRMNESASIKMTQSIAKELSILQANRNIEILPKPWILGLSLVAISIIIYAFTIPENAEVWLSFLPSVDEKIISITGWITFSFIILTLLDFSLKRMNDIRKYTGIIY